MVQKEKTNDNGADEKKVTESRVIDDIEDDEEKMLD